MEWSKILVRATNWVGDGVMSLPALRAIRGMFGEARIVVLARPGVADLYRREGCCDEVLVGTGELRAERFDAAILLPNAFEAAWVAWRAGIPRRIGYARDHRSLLLTDAIAVPKKGQIPLHERFYYLELLRRAGLLSELPAADSIQLDRPEEARRNGEKTFREMGFGGPVIGLSPGAHNSRAKQWPPERFVEAAGRLASVLGASVAIFGSEKERLLGKWIAEGIRRAGHRVLNLAGETSLGRFIELAATCRVFLTNDSGAMHVAAASGVATVAIFGPTIEVETGPVSAVARVVREEVECSRCMLRDCPTDHRCMARVAAERVVETALELVK